MIRFGIALGFLLVWAPCAVLATCTGDCNVDGDVTVDEVLTLASIDLGTVPASACALGGAGADGAVTVDTLVAAAGNAIDHCPLGSVPLGTRHFVINSAKSSFKAVLGSGLPPFNLGSFTGQDANGQSEPAFLDLEAGQPDVATGVATINVVNASKYIVASSTFPGGAITVCLRPLVPVMSAGAVGCKEGVFSVNFETTVDHDLGQVGVSGFTAALCEFKSGHVESPNQICATGMVGFTCRAKADCDTTQGAGDGVCGLGPSTCTSGKTGTACQSDADCDSGVVSQDGVCGTPEPHPGVCNGPIMPGVLPGGTGPGGVIIAPNERFHLTGLPVELLIENAPPCGDEGPGQSLTFALTSGVSRSTILDAGNSGQNGSGQTLSFDATGQNFSCADWQDQNGPGRLVLSAPALHLNPLSGGDIITAFTFDGAP